jgi:hypothetical protein
VLFLKSRFAAVPSQEQDTSMQIQAGGVGIPFGLELSCRRADLFLAARACG